MSGCVRWHRPASRVRGYMGFTTAVRTVLGKYATFSGRASRSEFWYFYLFNVLAMLAAALIDDGVSGVVVLALLLPNIAVMVCPVKSGPSPELGLA